VHILSSCADVCVCVCIKTGESQPDRNLSAVDSQVCAARGHSRGQEQIQRASANTLALPHSQGTVLQRQHHLQHSESLQQNEGAQKTVSGAKFIQHDPAGDVAVLVCGCVAVCCSVLQCVAVCCSVL